MATCRERNRLKKVDVTLWRVSGRAKKSKEINVDKYEEERENWKKFKEFEDAFLSSTSTQTAASVSLLLTLVLRSERSHTGFGGTSDLKNSSRLNSRS